MTSAQFRQQQGMVRATQEFLLSEVGQTALAILEAEGPLRKRDITVETARQLGRIEGADETLMRLRSLASYPTPVNVDNERI